MTQTENLVEAPEPTASYETHLVPFLVDKILVFVDFLSGHPLRPYQIAFAYRMVESILLEDVADITALFARQSGKSETVCNVVAALMILLPRLAKIYPMHRRLAKYREGLLVGIFAPTEGQAEVLFGRIVDRLTSEHAQEIFKDAEIDDKVDGKAKRIRLTRCGSRALMMTANPKAKIEAQTFHLILIDEAQDCFPGETEILTSDGYIPIRTIVESSHRDWFVAAQDNDENLVWSRVNRAFRTPRHSDLLRVDHELGSLYCTAEHPFLVGDARIAAQDLQPGTPLLLVSRADQPARAVPTATTYHFGLHAGMLAGHDAASPRRDAASHRPRHCVGQQSEGEAKPQGLGLHDGEQPYAIVSVSRQDVADFARDRASAEDTGRQWEGIDGAAAVAIRSLGQRVGARACVPYWSQESQRGSTDSLQGGHSASRPKAGDRSGRQFTSEPRPSEPGRPQDRMVTESRVVGVEVLQPGDPGFDRFSDRADWVYTLEVDQTHSYVADGILVGNCDDFIVRKSITPMKTATAGTMVRTGTPTIRSGDFKKTIDYNKRKHANVRGARQNHFEADWREVAKYSPEYKKTLLELLEQQGEDSQEFQMSYCLKWMLGQGMFTTDTRFDELGDVSMQELVKTWTRTPVVVGIDPARSVDSTVVTVCFVDWDRPDEYGFYTHRVLNWLELQNMPFEQQYAEIIRFLDPYNIFAVAVDAQGMGGAVAERLAILLRYKNCEVIGLPSHPSEQNKRWKHLQVLMDRALIGWPAGAKVRRLRSFKRFEQQMVDAEKHFQGPNILVRAPDEAGAHDDFVDSLALATYCTADLSVPEAEQMNNPFFAH